MSTLPKLINGIAVSYIESAKDELPHENSLPYCEFYNSESGESCLVPLFGLDDDGEAINSKNMKGLTDITPKKIEKHLDLFANSISTDDATVETASIYVISVKDLKKIGLCLLPHGYEFKSN